MQITPIMTFRFSYYVVIRDKVKERTSLKLEHHLIGDMVHSSLIKTGAIHAPFRLPSLDVISSDSPFEGGGNRFGFQGDVSVAVWTAQPNR
jgi:hypothetical protein